MARRSSSLAFVVLLAAVTPLAADEQPAPRPVGGAAPASRPSPALPGRVFVALNGGFRASSLDFADTRTEPVFAEDATWTADYRVRGGPEFDVGGGVRVWRNLVAQASYSRFTETSVAAVAGQVPHPFFFDVTRSITGETTALKQREQAIHVAAAWTAAVSPRMDVSVFAGPSIYQLDRDLVADVVYAEEYPYDTAAFDRAVVENVSERALGFHAGVDVTWMISRTVGVGGVVRFTRASLTLDSPASGQGLSLDAGGVQMGGGLRFRFGGPAVRPAPPRRPPSRPLAQPPTAGQPAPPQERRFALLHVDAPVFVLPDATRQPLRVLPVGTRLRVLAVTDGWYRVEFTDPQWGPRVGYVQSEHCTWAQP